MNNNLVPVTVSQQAAGATTTDGAESQTWVMMCVSLSLAHEASGRILNTWDQFIDPATVIQSFLLIMWFI